MMDLAKRRPSPSLVISCMALFVALSGSAVALQGVNQVRSDDIKAGAVKRSDIGANAINSAKVANDALTGADILESTLAISGGGGGGGGGGAPSGPAGGDLTGTYPNPTLANNSVGSANIIDSAVSAADLNGASVGASELQTNAVPADGSGHDGSTKLATNSVGYQEIKNGEVVGPSLAPITIRSAEVVNSSTQKTASVNCQGSERMLSGGGGIPNPTGAFTIARTVPLANGWVVVAHGPAQQWTLQVYAVCLGGP